MINNPISNIQYLISNIQSDNGPERNTPGSAVPFRGRKRSLYKGGVRVPAFVCWGNHFGQGIRMDFPTVTSDYLPAILADLKSTFVG